MAWKVTRFEVEPIPTLGVGSTGAAEFGFKSVPWRWCAKRTAQYVSNQAGKTRDTEAMFVKDLETLTSDRRTLGVNMHNGTISCREIADIAIGG